jgi:hypothetical protein
VIVGRVRRQVISRVWGWQFMAEESRTYRRAGEIGAVYLSKPTRPVSEMTDEELQAYALEVVDRARAAFGIPSAGNREPSSDTFSQSKRRVRAARAP